MSMLAVLAAAAVAAHFNGGHVPPVHRLAPVDADGDKISVSAPNPEAISLWKTCGQCHEVEKALGGSHFRTGLYTNEAPVRCNFEPWFLVDEKTGSVQAFSLGGIPGVKSLSDVGLTYWQFTKHFGRHFPGGGVGSDTNAMAEVGRERSRWFVTGPLEPNCLACHQQDSDYDSSEWARQVMRENWRGAAVAASGLGSVGGMNERLEGSWDRLRPENPDDHLFKVPENVTYDRRMFDERGRCIFRVGKPKNERCLACHAASEATAGHRGIVEDVHVQRGMKCIDCHTSGMDHRIATKTCRDCHTAPGGEGPRPTHAGFPIVHFSRLSCTVCHSGVTKDGKLAQVRTARANRIGVYGRAQWATDLPYIVEPVFVKGDDGVVRPCRMTWTTNGAESVSWRFAHAVRPARKARGAAPNKCADCHTHDSDFFFGKITPMYPGKDGPVKGEPVCQTKFLKADGVYHTAFGALFVMRPVFKVFLWTVFALICLFAAAAMAVALKKASAALEFRMDSFLAGAFKWIVDVGLALSVLCLVLTGVVGWIAGGMTWWWICLHMMAGGAFAAAVAVLLFYRTDERTRGVLPGLFWAFWTLLAAGVVFTAVMPMMTVFGEHGQAMLLWSHRCISLCFLALSCLVCRNCCRKR
jgi:hypothetical protein